MERRIYKIFKFKKAFGFGLSAFGLKRLSALGFRLSA